MEEKVGWINVKVGEISNLFRGITYKKDQASKIPIYGYKPILRANNINGSLIFNDFVYVPEGLIKDVQLIKKGDIIFAMSSGSKHLVGKSAQAKSDFQGSYGAFCALLRPVDEVSKEYLAYFFQGTEFRKLISKIAKGTNINNLKREHILEFDFPLPPLPEQCAIVSKIEQFFSELDNGIANLKLAQQQFKVYRQAVLKKAFEGELTRKWRKQQIDLPDAEDLLEQIWVKQEEEGKECKKPPKSKKPKKTKPLTETELCELIQLPKGWLWTRLEDIGEAIDPQPSHRTPPIFENGIPYVGIGDIDKETGEFDFNKARKVSSTVLDEHLLRYSIDEGDFIIGKIGTIGKPFLIPIRRFYALSANVVLVKSNDKLCLKRYLFYLSKSQIIEKQFLKGSKATTQAAFGIKKVRTLNIPLCSLTEQQAIVTEIETRLSVCDKVEQDIEENLEKAEALRQSILKRAFEGKLLSKWELEEVRSAPDWEPAELLLEKIRVEKVGSGKKGKA